LILLTKYEKTAKKSKTERHKKIAAAILEGNTPASQADKFDISTERVRSSSISIAVLKAEPHTIRLSLILNSYLINTSISPRSTISAVTASILNK
jgi:hypothetical protein